MAIKLTNRLTQPKGTILPDPVTPQVAPFSNPATSAAGALGGAQGNNVPQVNMWAGTTPGYNAPVLPSYNPFQPVVNAFSQVGNSLKTVGASLGIDGQGLRDANGNPIALRGAMGQTIELTPQKTTPSNIFKEPPKSNLVGSGDLSAAPGMIDYNTLKQILPNLTNEQIRDTMFKMGYVPGNGNYWVRSGQTTGTADPLASGQGATDERGRPLYVDPTALSRGERVTAASGLTFVGGAPLENEDGTTTSQYAVTLPDNIGEDKHGKFKWVSTVKKDADGNWVRVYSRQLRKVYRRNSRKGREGNVNSGGDTYSARQEGQDFTQLVTLRANYG